MNKLKQWKNRIVETQGKSRKESEMHPGKKMQTKKFRR